MAHDPILAQEITNGHAARMRYSRFRAAMLGLEPQRRNRTNANKSRVSKSKKEPKTKKEEPSIKQDPAAPSTAVHAEPTATLSPKVKQEHVQISPEPTSSDSAAGFAPSAIHPPDLHTQLHTRLLTPCSDSDVLAASQGFASSPSNDMLHPEPPFDFSASTQYSHDHMPWSRAHAYPTFGVGYDMESYANGFCQHQHSHQAPDGLTVSGGLLEGHGNHVMVKHEEWDAHQYQ